MWMLRLTSSKWAGDSKIRFRQLDFWHKYTRLDGLLNIFLKFYWIIRNQHNLLLVCTMFHLTCCMLYDPHLKFRSRFFSLNLTQITPGRCYAGLPSSVLIYLPSIEKCGVCFVSFRTERLFGNVLKSVRN